MGYLLSNMASWQFAVDRGGLEVSLLALYSAD